MIKNNCSVGGLRWQAQGVVLFRGRGVRRPEGVDAAERSLDDSGHDSLV
jgi:hypothetical protein